MTEIVTRIRGALYLGAAAVTWFFTKHGIEWIMQRRVFRPPMFVVQMGEYFYHLAGLLAASFVLFILVKNSQSRSFIEDVSIETSKVTWPSGKDTVNATIVVGIGIIIASVFLFLVDVGVGSFFQWSVKLLMQSGF